jgi:hypothetical protein
MSWKLPKVGKQFLCIKKLGSSNYQKYKSTLEHSLEITKENSNTSNRHENKHTCENIVLGTRARNIFLTWQPSFISFF